MKFDDDQHGKIFGKIMNPQQSGKLVIFQMTGKPPCPNGSSGENEESSPKQIEGRQEENEFLRIFTKV